MRGILAATMNSTINLVTGLQVRKEIFGLLFYDGKKSELYFIGSGDLLSSEFFEGGRILQELLLDLPEERKKHILKLLGLLKRKGLIYEQSVD